MNERNAVARIESGPRLPAHAESTVATIDIDVALRLGPGLLHALHDRHPDGRLATGDLPLPVVSTAQDPCPANVDENDNRKRKEDDMYCDACDRPTPAQPLPAGAVALKGLDLRTLRYFVVGGNQLDHPALNCRPTWTIA